MERINAGQVDVVRVPFDGFAGRGDPPNAYVIPARPLTLIDAGIAYPGNLERIAAALEPFDLTLSDIETVVLTHWHWDHTGLVREIADRSDAVFLYHPSERVRLLGGVDEVGALAAATRTFYTRHGFNKAIAGMLTGLAFEHERVDLPVERTRPLGEGEKVRAGTIDLCILLTPGHTPGSICLHHAGSGLLFSSDSLYGRLFPHPVAEIPSTGDQSRSILKDYLPSLKRLAALDSTNVLPGHGKPFHPAAKVINPITSFIERRLSRLTRLLVTGPLSAAEVMQAFFPSIDEIERCHAVAEVVFLVEVLEARGAVTREDDRGVFRYRLT